MRRRRLEKVPEEEEEAMTKKRLHFHSWRIIVSLK
jgi:hypothetical protein